MWLFRFQSFKAFGPRAAWSLGKPSANKTAERSMRSVMRVYFLMVIVGFWLYCQILNRLKKYKATKNRYKNENREWLYSHRECYEELRVKFPNKVVILKQFSNNMYKRL